jgi:hypothetical protein
MLQVAGKITQNTPYFFSSAIVKISICNYKISNSQIPLKVNRNFGPANELIHRCFIQAGEFRERKVCLNTN